MKKILITGSAGFIAPHIAEEALNLGWEVIGVDTQEVENQVKDKKIKLTEKESNIILYISNSTKPVSIEELQLNVWGYHSDLETHTVETHVYRLRKKILNKSII